MESVDARLRSMCGISQRRLSMLLGVSGEPRQLHIHSELIRPFERVCGAAWLRKHGIEKIFRFDPSGAAPPSLARIYLIPMCLKRLKCALDQIGGLAGVDAAPAGAVVVVVVPKALAVHEALVEEEGLGEVVSLKSFGWDFLYSDRGAISLELPGLFRSAFVAKDLSPLEAVAGSLRTLFQTLGEPRLFVSIGRLSSGALELYDVVRDRDAKGESEFGALLMMDRDQDYASGLLTPATYGGLLHEIFDVKSGELDLAARKTERPILLPEDAEPKPKPAKMSLDSHSDPIHSEIRHLHFSSVFQILSSKAKELNAEGANIANAHISEMKQVIATKLQRVIDVKKCLSNHILACETIVSAFGDKFEETQIAERSMLFNKNRKSNMTHLEENVCTDPNKFQSLKLLCLLSLTQGITSEEYNSFITKYLHAFGYKYMYVFHNLIAAGLLVAPSNTKFQLGIPNMSSISEKLPRWQNNFQANANKLKQLPNDPEEITVKQPNCPSYVFNGSYIPLVAAVAKILLGNDNVNELITKLSLLNDVKIGGPILEKFKSGVDDLGDRLASLSTTNPMGDIDVACKDLKFVSTFLRSEEVKNPVLPLKPRSLFVYIVGGMTQAEVAACHLVEKLTGGSIIMGSDTIIASEHLIQSCM